MPKKKTAKTVGLRPPTKATWSSETQQGNQRLSFVTRVSLRINKKEMVKHSGSHSVELNGCLVLKHVIFESKTVMQPVELSSK